MYRDPNTFVLNKTIRTKPFKKVKNIKIVFFLILEIRGHDTHE
jgi:hypothetical protein